MTQLGGNGSNNGGIGGNATIIHHQNSYRSSVVVLEIQVESELRMVIIILDKMETMEQEAF